jgi:hypothetical protein
LRVVEDRRRGAVRLEMLSAVAVVSHLPVSLDVYHESARRGRIHVGASTSELGLSLAPQSRISFSLPGLAASPGRALSSLLATADKDTVTFLDCKAIQGGAELRVSGPPGCRLYHPSGAHRTARCVLTCRFADGGRQIVHVAPLMLVCNELASALDVVVDDGAPAPAQRSAPRWVKDLLAGASPGAQSKAASVVVFAPNLRAGGKLAVMDSSSQGHEYRLRLREVGGSWCEPVLISLADPPSPGRVLCQGTRTVERGVLDVCATFDERCSLRVSVSARYIVKNLSGTAVCVSSATKTAPLGRLAARHNIFRVHDYLYFSEREACVGVGGEWSKKTLRLPCEGESDVVRLPSSTSASGGLQLMFAAPAPSLVVIRPLVQVFNALSVPIQVLNDGFRAQKAPFRVNPAESAPFHEPHHKLDGVLSPGGSKVRLTVEAVGNFGRSGVLSLEYGNYALAVRATRPGDNAGGAVTMTPYRIIGVDCSRADAGGRGCVVRFLETPTYGPPLSVSNFSRYVVHLADEENARGPVCRALPGGDVSSFAWTALLPAKRRAVYVSVQIDGGAPSDAREVYVPALEGSSAADVRFNATLGGADVALCLRFQRGNGFMSVLHVFESAAAVASASAVADSLGPEVRSSLALHVALPRASVEISDLLSVSLEGVSCSVIQTPGRLQVAADVYGVDVENNAPNPWHKVILTRATRGRLVDERSPLLSLSTITRLPRTQLNPSNLLHFELCRFMVQPVVLKLESRFVDRVGLYFARLFMSLRLPPDSSLVAATEACDRGDDRRRSRPLYFGENVRWTPLVVNLTFDNNGRVRVGLLGEDGRKLMSLLRVLVVAAIPPIKDANIQLEPPSVATKLYLSGELSQEIANTLGRQAVKILRQVLPNVAILTAIQSAVTGRKKGDANTRRVARARAFAKRAVSHLTSDSWSTGGSLVNASSSTSGSQSGHDKASDRLAGHVTGGDDDDGSPGGSEEDVMTSQLRRFWEVVDRDEGEGSV